MSVKELPAAASVSYVAEVVCKLSRSRFYDLMNAGVFPEPVRNASSNRPIYSRELIEKCREIRRTSVGFNGQPVLFNRKLNKTRKPIQGRNSRPDSTQYSDMTDSLKSLGLTTTNDAVAQAVAELYPNGINGHDQGEVIRRVFLHIQPKGANK